MPQPVSSRLAPTPTVLGSPTATPTAAQSCASPRVPQKPLCAHCGADTPDAFEILSRHRTSVGTTVWLRCSCDALQVRVVTRTGAQIVARGRRA